jgi:hypothetical protein
MNYYWRQAIVGLLRHTSENVPELEARSVAAATELDRNLTSEWLEEAFTIFQEAALATRDPIYVTGTFYCMRALDEVERREGRAEGAAGVTADGPGYAQAKSEGRSEPPPREPKPGARGRNDKTGDGSTTGDGGGGDADLPSDGAATPPNAVTPPRPRQRKPRAAAEGAGEGTPGRAPRRKAPAKDGTSKKAAGDDDITREAQRGLVELFDRVGAGASLEAALDLFPLTGEEDNPHD